MIHVGPLQGPEIGFGPELRRRRRAAGLSLTALARAINYSKSHLSKIENGLANPHPGLGRACDTILNAGGALRCLVPEPRSSADAKAVPFSGLPRDTRHFTGRTAELEAVTSVLTPDDGDRTARMCIVHGMPGSGKTALTVRAAHLLADQFPDGCLYLDLHGHTAGMRPVSTMEALDRCLRRLGVSGDNMPDALDDRAGLLRARLDGRRLLLIVDDPVNMAHVEPLIPNTAGTGVLVASRRWLAGLDEAGHVELGELPVADGMALFRSISGIDTDPAIETVVRRCGLLPLPIRVAAARFRTQPQAGLNAFTDRLSGSLHALADGDRMVGDLLATSLRSMPADDQELFVTLADQPGADFGIHAAAVLSGVHLEVVGPQLDRLADMHLLTRSRPDRFAFHALVREYALSRRMCQNNATALRRLADFYTTGADLADQYIAPHRYHRPLGTLLAPSAVDLVRDRASSIRWVEQEFDNLVAMCDRAATTGLNEQCWRIAHSLQGFAFLTKVWHAWMALQRTGLAAARRAADREAEGYLLNGLGLAHLELHDSHRAEDYFRTALHVFGAIADERGLTNTIGNLAWLHLQLGDNLAARHGHRRALAFHRRAGSVIAAAITLRGLASAELALGYLEEASHHLAEALETFDACHLSLDRAMALNILGDLHQAAGEREPACAAYREAAELSLASGSRYEHARALEGMAATEPSQGAAREALAQATAIYTELGAPASARTRTALDRMTSSNR